jgi:asparagine synthase (glutamine-hydrolysing)
MREVTTSQITTLTLGFDEFSSSRDDETGIAAQVAGQFGADHHIHHVRRDDFLNDLPHFFDAMDQPTIDGVNSYFISKAAKQYGLKVAFSGLGGDELFGGYPSFQNIPCDVARVNLIRMSFDAAKPDWKKIPQGMRAYRIFPKVEAMIRYGNNVEGAYFARRCVFTPNELPGVMDRDLAISGLSRLKPLQLIADQSRQRSLSSFGHIALLESAMYMRNQLLRDADWASMAHSVEIRMPLVDSVLLRKLSPILHSDAKWIGKSALAKSPQYALPQAVMQRSKTGFSTPLQHWLQDEKELGSWRNSPALCRKGTKWAKRWAFSVSQHFFGKI